MGYRKQWLIGLVGVFAACAQAPAGDEHDQYHPPGDDPSQLVRKRVDRLTSSEVESLRRGIEEMKSRPVSDRTSWDYWANIHGVPGVPSDPLWDQCEHGTLHFLTWHRGYLYFFEKVLRDASGDPALTVPYWDWSVNRQLPSIYRSPADAAMNPLFDDDRQLNNGGSLPERIVIDDRDTAFNAIGFGTFSSQLDRSPHGAVHMLVGGFGGTMSRVPTSARDPIFWAHHGNVDRLWNRWLEQGGGRENPNNSQFLNREVTFVDVDGNNVSIQAGDLLDQTALGYRYDDDPVPATEEPPMRTRLLATSAAGPEAAADSDPKPLGLEPEVVELTVADDAKEVLKSAARAAGPRAERRLLIDVVGIQFKEVPSYVYGVYLNLPADAEKEQTKRHYVGAISFFAREHAHGDHAAESDDNDEEKPVRFTETLDASATVARLREADVSVVENPTVTLRPITVVPPAGDAENARQRNAASAEKAQVTYQRIELRMSR